MASSNGTKVPLLDENPNHIQGLVVWEQKSRYPVVSAGSTNPNDIADDPGTLNGNLIRIRNFVNGLRDIWDNFVASIPLATADTAGLMSTETQSFSGTKYFLDCIGVGQPSVRNAVIKWFRSADNKAMWLTSNHTDNREIAFPDKSGTVALTTDITDKQPTLGPSSNVEVNSVLAPYFYAKGLNNGKSTIASLADGAERQVYLPNRGGNIPLVDSGVSIAGPGMVENENHSLSPHVDGTTVTIVNSKLSVTNSVKAVAITIPFTEADRMTKFFGLPGGVLVKSIITTSEGKSKSVVLTNPVTVSDGDVFRLQGDDAGNVVARNQNGDVKANLAYDDNGGAVDSAVLIINLV